MKLMADYRQQFKASQGLDHGGKQNTANQMFAVTSNFARFAWHDAFELLQAKNRNSSLNLASCRGLDIWGLKGQRSAAATAVNITLRASKEYTKSCKLQ